MQRQDSQQRGNFRAGIRDGCPPEAHQIAAVVDLVVQVLQGKANLPPKGSVIGATNNYAPISMSINKAAGTGSSTGQWSVKDY